MTNEELKALLTQADELNKTSKFEEAEKLANQVFAEVLLLKEEDAELHCNTLMTLAESARLKGDYEQVLALTHSVINLAEEHKLTQLIARAQNTSGLVYLYLGTYDKALEYLHKTLITLEKSGKNRMMGGTIVNIGNVYAALGSYDKALEYLHNALSIFDEIGEKPFKANVTGGIGVVYASIASYDKALEYFHKALAFHEELGDTSGAANVTGNIGNVYLFLGSYDKALEYLHTALATHEEMGNKSGAANVTGNIGTLYAEKKYEGYDAMKAEEYLLKALAMFTEIGAKANLLELHKTLSELYEKEERGIEALAHYKKHIETEKEINIEEVKKQNQQREREKQIAIAQATSNAKHEAMEQLLHNVLPPEIANRILAGKKIADTHESVSVLFIDIVGFTEMSANVHAGELIDILDIVFTRFDTICKKHGLEKIKTIGDAYMAVCGAPVAVENHAERAALAALEMLEDFSMEQRFSVLIELDFRIGLHSGSVVAGIIGKNKYAYDLWGDAVNTASRMESHGEPGKIHCSEEFMHALTLSSFLSLMSLQSFTFQERVEMHIKGKGMMKTYYLVQST
ncbi:MAG: tetratricopeptide repeat protein [Ignavibacteria bacterium]|nr:tetratricopeptide repeat protein [Ignavibacteria bacterium]